MFVFEKCILGTLFPTSRYNFQAIGTYNEIHILYYTSIIPCYQHTSLACLIPCQSCTRLVYKQTSFVSVKYQKHIIQHQTNFQI